MYSTATGGKTRMFTTNTVGESDKFYVLGETLRPLLTNSMGSAIEIFDTKGPENAGPPPHVHPWEEIYIVLSGRIEVEVEGESRVLEAGGVAHVPANKKHGYRNLTEAHFLTIVTKGNAAAFFREVSANVEMNPPDVPGVVRVASNYGIEFMP
jgi:quercetin dioxygenase-like cupin family protein